MKISYISVFVTCPSASEARAIARSLINKRLVACANILSGVDSIFRWNGKIDRSAEALMICKTEAGNFKAVEKEVKRVHSYEVPEVIAMPIAAGSDSYLGWISASVKGARKK